MLVVLVVVGVAGAAAVLADSVCVGAIAVWFWECWIAGLVCVAVVVLPLVPAVVPSARLEAV